MNESAVDVLFVEAHPERSAPRLTPREAEVVRRIALGGGRGWRCQGVAESLGISRSTMYRHLHNAEAKYGVSSVIDLFRALGWLRVPA